VERVLLHAWEEGKRFSVVVVDSRPMLEGRLCPATTLHLSDVPLGKKLLAVLAAAAIPCTYLLLPALGAIISEVTLALVGAHSLHSNGAVFSRAGTALVAMMAKQVSVPFLVCCETYKFAEGVQLDSFTKNELGEPPALLFFRCACTLTAGLAAPVGALLSTFPSCRARGTLALESELNLEILNPLYDLTPPSSITAVVTEVGIIPPNSISSIPLALGRQSI
jgi:translation initiation factor eIF-2B subunit delta